MNINPQTIRSLTSICVKDKGEINTKNVVFGLGLFQIMFAQKLYLILAIIVLFPYDICYNFKILFVILNSYGV